MQTPEGRVRVVIEGLGPEIDGGAFPIKRLVGECVTVEADIFTDGHDAVAASLLCRHADEEVWSRFAMEPLGNDRWRGEFPAKRIGQYFYTVEGWIDRFETWRSGMVKRIEAGQDA